MSGKNGYSPGVLGFVLGTLGLAFFMSKPAASATPPPPYAPRAADFDTEDEKTLITNAMLQMSKELQAFDQAAAANVYLDQSASPPPGTASRALQHVAEGLMKLGHPRNVAKLRALAKKIYTDPIPVASF